MNTYVNTQLDALGDATRRAIVDRLRRGPVSVGKLAEEFPVSRPAISKHLRILHDAQLVTEVREGRNRIYRLNPEPLRNLDRWLDQYRRFWTVNLLNLKKHVESKERGRKQ